MTLFRLKDIFIYFIFLTFFSLSFTFATALFNQAQAETVRMLVKVKGALSAKQLSQAAQHGTILRYMKHVKMLDISIDDTKLNSFLQLNFVDRTYKNLEYTIQTESHENGVGMWNLDMVDVMDSGGDNTRNITETGSGVLVVVMDTGLENSWREYFPVATQVGEPGILTQYAASFFGSNFDTEGRASPRDKWEKDTNGHGTHVTSTILGWLDKRFPRSTNGVAPGVTILPLQKFANHGKSTTTDTVAAFNYLLGLTQPGGPLAGYPTVVNMSFGGFGEDPALTEVMQLARSSGIVLVASAGNSGLGGLSLPGGCNFVISAAASGYRGQFVIGGNDWWFNHDIIEGTETANSFIANFSSKASGPDNYPCGEQLDVTAPGVRVWGPFTAAGSAESNPTWGEYRGISGTSMAAPHVTGAVALLLEKNPNLTPDQIEWILLATARKIPAGSYPGVGEGVSTWDESANHQGCGLIDVDDALGIANSPPSSRPEC